MTTNELDFFLSDEPLVRLEIDVTGRLKIVVIGGYDPDSEVGDVKDWEFFLDDVVKETLFDDLRPQKEKLTKQDAKDLEPIAKALDGIGVGYRRLISERLKSKSRYIDASPTFENTGLVRLKTILSVFPVCKSTWWDGVKSGRFPKPVKIGPRTTAWRAEDIRKLIEEKY